MDRRTCRVVTGTERGSPQRQRRRWIQTRRTGRSFIGWRRKKDADGRASRTARKGRYYRLVVGGRHQGRTGETGQNDAGLDAIGRATTLAGNPKVRRMRL